MNNTSRKAEIFLHNQYTISRDDVLGDPANTHWVKSAIIDLDMRDPVDAMKEIELLSSLTNMRLQSMDQENNNEEQKCYSKNGIFFSKHDVICLRQLLNALEYISAVSKGNVSGCLADISTISQLIDRELDSFPAELGGKIHKAKKDVELLLTLTNMRFRSIDQENNMDEQKGDDKKGMYLSNTELLSLGRFLDELMYISAISKENVSGYLADISTVSQLIDHELDSFPTELRGKMHEALAS